MNYYALKMDNSQNLINRLITIINHARDLGTINEDLYAEDNRDNIDYAYNVVMALNSNIIEMNRLEISLRVMLDDKDFEARVAPHLNSFK